MRNLCLYTLLALFIIYPVAVALAQTDYGQVTESSADNAFGVGARAVAMGEAVVVSVMDGAAIFYNPAVLTRIKRPEFFAALSHEKMKSVANWSVLQSVPSHSDLARTRLNALDLSVPVPTYRGSLVIAFGVNRTKSFDYVQGYSLPGQVARLETSGGIREWSAAAAVELSPRLAVGGTISYLHGAESYSWNYTRILENPVRKTNNIESRYSAIGIRMGLTLEANRYLTFGFTVDAPTRFNIKQDYLIRTTSNGVSVDTIGVYEYDLSHPFIFTGGVALRYKTLIVEGDLGYADWSQLEYKNGIDLDFLNPLLHNAYREVLQYRIGAEFTLPRYSMVLRGGYNHEPLPFSGADIFNQVEKDRSTVSFGLGFLIDRLVMLDLAYARATYTMHDGKLRLSEKFTSDKVLVSIGYRI